MNRPIVLALFAALLGAASGAAQSVPQTDSTLSGLEGTIRGRFQGQSRVLPYAVVEVTSTQGRHGAVTDSLGRYVIQSLPPGEVRVRASHPGHDAVTLVVLLPPSESVTVDLELTGAPVELPGVAVSREALGASDPALEEPTDRPRPELELQLLDMAPGVGQPGLMEAVRALPGNDPANATDVLFMRGSTTDLKLVLLDGVPVYTPFHVAGLLRSFEPSVLESANLHTGGAPARYDGGLTHILELQTRRARRDRPRASGSMDLLSVTAAAELPLGSRAGAIVSGRSLHDLGRAMLGGDGPYGYRDLLASATADVAPGHELRATGFWNSESVRLDFKPTADDAASWSNRAVSTGYRGLLGGVRLDVTAGGSAYGAELPLQPTGDPGEPLPDALLATAETDRLRLVAEATWGSPNAPTRAGLSYESIDATFSARALGGGPRSGSRGRISTIGTYLDVTRGLARGVTLRGGLRGDLFSGGISHLSPRAALLWEIGPEALLTVAVGRYHQPTRTPDSEVERTLAEVATVGVDPVELLPVATADHVVLSLDQRLGGTVALGLEGFWKRYEGLSASEAETVRSSGIDVRVLSAGERGSVWLGYGLSWFWSTIDLSGHATDFAGRHLLSAGITGRVVGPFRAEARVAYGAGLPYSSLPFSSGDALGQGPLTDETLSGAAPDPPLVEGLDEEFLRIDVEIHALFEPEWSGRPWQVRPYVRILNALDRRDALFYTFRPWRSESATPLAQRSLLPLLGVAFSF